MAPERVIVIIQENHTTDNYLRSAAAYGAAVTTGWHTDPNPPAKDQPHDRLTCVKWLRGQITGHRAQFNTAAVLPFYAWLAASGALVENHCSGYATNSTPNHLLIVGGQSPTLKNPSQSHEPVWDLPSLPGHCADHGRTWRAYTGASGYPVSLYKQLRGSTGIVASDRFVTDAAAGTLPELSMLWHDPPNDEHPPADVTLGHDKVWQAVDAVVRAGLWDSTVFMLTWDDWGGYDDHVVPPNVETDLGGVQLAYGPRVPLLVFGGPVRPGIDHRWSYHPSIPKTAIDLLDLPPLGVPRLDTAPSLADLVDRTGTVHMPHPPAYGSAIIQPPVPTPRPVPAPPPPAPVAKPHAVGPVLLRGGGTLPPPNDVVVR